MKQNPKIQINLKDFFATGKFDHIKLGQTKDWILQNFPKPDAYPMVANEIIWTYGTLEFHFDQENKLYLIFSDHFHNLHGGEYIELEKWFLNDLNDLSLRFVLEKLNNEAIDYKKLTDNLGVVVRLNSGVELTFENINDEDDLAINEFTMTSFGLVAENPYRWKNK